MRTLSLEDSVRGYPELVAKGIEDSGTPNFTNRRDLFTRSDEFGRAAWNGPGANTVQKRNRQLEKARVNDQGARKLTGALPPAMNEAQQSFQRVSLQPRMDQDTQLYCMAI